VEQEGQLSNIPQWIHELAQEIIKEINDTNFKTHGAQWNVAKGCRGPLCLKARKDHDREKGRAKRAKEGRRQNKRTYCNSEKDQLIIEFQKFYDIEQAINKLQTKKYGS